MKQGRVILAMLLLGLLVSAASAGLPEGKLRSSGQSNSAASLDFDTYIDANNLLMFVTNMGSFAYDKGVSLGKSDGLYYPYIGLDGITSGTNTNTVCFAAGLWLGGVDAATGDTIISVAEYSNDFWPGPMQGGTFIANADIAPAYRVYKLYKDSLANNPSDDWTNWPVGQGAPLDGNSQPEMRGDQMLWTVFNDANPAPHTNYASSSAGMGIEVQLTAWAKDEPGSIVIPGSMHLPIEQLGNSSLTADVVIVDTLALTGDDYMIVTDSLIGLGNVWHLINVSTGQTVLSNQTIVGGGVEVDGMAMAVSYAGSQFTSFEVVANGAGPLVPPEAGAFRFQDFPTPAGADSNGNPSDRQQVGEGHWALHTGDNGGSCAGGSRAHYGEFISRVLRDGGNTMYLGAYDYEMRFTGSNTNPGINGGVAIRAFQDDLVTWVPFELWRIGIGTPDDPSDDVRLVPLQMDIGEDSIYNLESWGCADSIGTYGADGEHSASGADNDPYTDWIYWYTPFDMSPGDAGYQAIRTEWFVNNDIGAGYDLLDQEIMARTVLINWNGDTTTAGGPPFNQDLPELGTVFRITTIHGAQIDTFTFTALTPHITMSAPEGLSIYLKYKLINKGSRTFNDFFTSFWFDPDLGYAGDDYVGCDTINDIFYCYNDGGDFDYGSTPPAFGGKIIEGLIVSSPGDTAMVDGKPVSDYKNLGMSSFARYINGTDPGSARETYWYMNGLSDQAPGTPMINPTNGQVTKYFGSGDPVAGTGWLDLNSSDRRMMASCGPINMAPNDTHQVIIKLSIGQGSDALSSITSLKTNLNWVDIGDVGVNDGTFSGLPHEYSLSQNFPNPFNPSTAIQYSLPTRSKVTIDIFNLLGQKVKTVVQAEIPAGVHTANWDGTNNSGEAVSSGVYFYRIKAGDFVKSRKMMLLK